MTEVVRTKSGINIIFDELSNISTCSVEVFVKTRSKDEADNEEGISHIRVTASRSFGNRSFFTLKPS